MPINNLAIVNLHVVPPMWWDNLCSRTYRRTQSILRCQSGRPIAELNTRPAGVLYPPFHEHQQPVLTRERDGFSTLLKNECPRDVYSYKLRPARSQPGAKVLCVSLFNAAPAFRAAAIRICATSGQVLHEVVSRDQPLAMKQESWAVVKLANAVEWPRFHIVVDWFSVRVEDPDVSELARLEQRGQWGNDLDWFYQDDRRRWFPAENPAFTTDIEIVGRDGLPGLSSAQRKAIKDGQRAFHHAIRDSIDELWNHDNRVPSMAPEPKHLPVHAPKANPDRDVSYEELLAQPVPRRNRKSGKVEWVAMPPSL